MLHIFDTEKSEGLGKIMPNKIKWNKYNKIKWLLNLIN
jgi:hypothetical protein